MSPPKKGKDLSALKARLAKKAAADAPPPDAAVEQPQSEIATQAAPADLPPPGEVAPEPEPAPKPKAQGDQPFGGGASFDPNAGVIADSEAAEAAPKGSAGMNILIGLLGIAVGGGIGWVARQATDTGARKSSAKAKGTEMLGEVQRLSEIRGNIKSGLDGVKTAVEENPDQGAQAMTDLLTANFGGDQPTPDKLFGWQMASMHPRSIYQVFTFYTRYAGLQMALVALASHINTNSKVLKPGSGPGNFAVVYKNGGAVLVEYVQPICNLEEKAACADGGGADAAGYEVRETLGGPTAILPKDQASPLLSEGPMFIYAFGETPGDNAAHKYTRLIEGVEKQLGEMEALEAKALGSLEAYSNSPTVDGSNQQADPGE